MRSRETEAVDTEQEQEQEQRLPQGAECAIMAMAAAGPGRGSVHVHESSAWKGDEGTRSATGTYLANALLSKSAFGVACGVSPPLCWVAMLAQPRQDGCGRVGRC